MELRYNPIAYIHEYGNAYHKLELYRTIGVHASENEENEEIGRLIKKIRSLQNFDGSWPWQWKQDDPGGVIQTTKIIRILSKLKKNSVAKAITFINAIQRIDGGWSENLGLRGYIPEEWVFWRMDCSSAFFTGEVVCSLVLSGCKRNSATKKGITYLEDTQKTDGGWPLNSDPQYAKADAICTNSAIRALIAMGRSRNSPILQRALKAIKSHYNIWMEAAGDKSEPEFAAAMLESFMILDPKNKRIVDLMEYLVSIQRQDGGWGWRKFASDPDKTLRCIQVLTAAHTTVKIV